MMDEGQRTTDDGRQTTEAQAAASIGRRPSSVAAAGLGRLLLVLAAVFLPVLIGQQTPVSVTQALGGPDLLNVSGLAAPEQGENGPFRWSTGPVSLDLQPLGYPLTVR